MTIKITIIAGTNRVGSMSAKVGKSLIHLYEQDGVSVDLMDLSQLPTSIFSPMSYKEKPSEFNPWQQRILDSNGLLFVVPEYNGSFPGALKLFIDMWKYPESFENRCVAYVGIAAGQWGGLRPVEHLQGVMGYRNAHQFSERIFINQLYTRWDNDGQNFRKLHEKEYDINALLEKQATGFIRFCRAMNRDD